MITKKYTPYVIMSAMESSFSNWLLEELDKRQWSQSDLSRSSGLTRGAISNIINEKNDLGLDSVIGIAKAFRIPVSKVLSAAGIIPKMSKETEAEEQLLHMFRQLSKYDQEAILDFVEFKLNK